MDDEGSVLGSADRGLVGGKSLITGAGSAKEMFKSLKTLPSPGDLKAMANAFALNLLMLKAPPPGDSTDSTPREATTTLEKCVVTEACWPCEHARWANEGSVWALNPAGKPPVESFEAGLRKGRNCANLDEYVREQTLSVQAQAGDSGISSGVYRTCELYSGGGSSKTTRKNQFLDPRPGLMDWLTNKGTLGSQSENGLICKNAPCGHSDHRLHSVAVLSRSHTRACREARDAIEAGRNEEGTACIDGCG